VTQTDGYRGIWYGCQRVDTEYVWKYSGGLGTYCAKHTPLAIYAPEVDRTFFCYAGRPAADNHLLNCVSYYDHATGTVPRPTVLAEKLTDDAHDNATLALDDDGRLWVFCSSHGVMRGSQIFRSREPYRIDDFEIVLDENFSYPQPWSLPGRGILLLHTLYDNWQRRLFTRTFVDGAWSEPQLLAHIEWGHYQISRRHGERVGTAFNFHPAELGCNYRTNLYYLETNDFGETWTTVDGRPVETPITEVDNDALIHDYQAEGGLAYLKDIAFDARGNPIILHVVSTTWEPGQGGPRRWIIAHWTGDEWAFRPVTTSDSCYDTGCLHVESAVPDAPACVPPGEVGPAASQGSETWRLIGPTDPGPQPGNPGGEMAMWTSTDAGCSWTKVRQLTAGSEYNHTYARRPIDAHPDFYALWADGHGRELSPSRLYFCNRDGTVVRRLPTEMSGDAAEPEVVS
jgi:hypothetical protein